MGDSLSSELYQHIMGQFCALPPLWIKRSCWVMNQEWYDECKKLCQSPSFPVPAPKFIFGLPLIVTADGGAPHLITD